MRGYLEEQLARGSYLARPPTLWLALSAGQGWAQIRPDGDRARGRRRGAPGLRVDPRRTDDPLDRG
jgi:hypothetical protein